jgi:predicted nucleic acid-binding protein
LKKVASELTLMIGRHLLDTNLVVALIADDAVVKEHLGQADEAFAPSITVGELCCGAYKSVRVTDNLAHGRLGGGGLATRLTALYL